MRLVDEHADSRLVEASQKPRCEMPAVMVPHHSEGAQLRTEMLQLFTKRFHGRGIAGDIVADEADEIDLFFIDRVHRAPDEAVVAKAVVAAALDAEATVSGPSPPYAFVRGPA